MVLSLHFAGEIKLRYYGENKQKITYEQLVDLHRQNMERDPKPGLIFTMDWERGMQWVYAPENQGNNKVAIFSFENDSSGDLLATALKNKGVSFERRK